MNKITDFQAWGERILEKSKLQGQCEPSSGKTTIKSAVQMPLWPEATRGVPNGVLRSALFGAIKKGPRCYMEETRIASLEGIQIKYTGQRLDQGDLDVWECVLHIARLQEMGQQCRFRAYSMLQMLGMTDSGKNNKTLHNRLLRLQTNTVEVDQGRFTYMGSLIDEAVRDKVTKEYVVVLNAKLRPLFGADQFTQVDWNVRNALKSKPLAQWLHGFYSSHAKPFPLKVATLLELSGSENKDPYSARQNLEKSLDALDEACEVNGQPFGYKIKDGLVHVEKTPSDSQRRSLTRKKGYRSST
jgi:hypothetical protein